jgi:putative ABC transport system permease protein
LGNTLGVKWPGKPVNQESHFWILHTDSDLSSVYKFEMLQGRYFSDQFPTDATNAYVINEAAAKSMDLKSPLSEEIQVWGKTGRIIGVTRDFHFTSFHSAIEPLIMRIPDKNEQGGRFTVISIRFRAGALDNTLAYVEKMWRKQMNGIPLNYYFFDEALDMQYKSERRMSSIFGYFSFLSILLACLGLFGLVSLSVQQRTKEVGVRKALGATTWNISFILSKEFLKWVVFSNLVAWPIAYFVMRTWLQDFVYRIDLTIYPFLMAGVLVLVIAFLTVGWQTIKAAKANPVEALKYE